MPERGRRLIAIAAFLLALPGAASGAKSREPIIDMHLHASITPRSRPEKACTGDQPLLFLPVDPGRASASAPAVSCRRPILSATTADQLRSGTITALRRSNVVRGVLVGRPAELEQWSSAAPGLFIPAAIPASAGPEAIARLRRLAETGQVRVFAEAGLQYEGMSADDPRADPFWALAEQLDIPVGIHLGEGMPLIGAEATSRYRASLTSPFQLEPVIKQHPKLRIYVMHAASPLIDEMIAMLFTYPSLYVDISATDWGSPRAQFYDELKRLVDAGFGKRILFGSDQTIFPQAIGLAIRSIEEAPFLSEQQKRDIFYNNAARFLRLTPQQIAADHARK